MIPQYIVTVNPFFKKMTRYFEATNENKKAILNDENFLMTIKNGKRAIDCRSNYSFYTVDRSGYYYDYHREDEILGGIVTISVININEGCSYAILPIDFLKENSTNKNISCGRMKIQKYRIKKE